MSWIKAAWFGAKTFLTGGGWALPAIVAALGLVAIGAQEIRVRLTAADLRTAEATVKLREGEIAAAVTANRATTAALAQLYEYHEQALAAVAADRDAALATLDRVEAVKRRLAHERQTLDGPVAPALSNAIGGLLKPPAGAVGGGRDAR